MRLALSLSTAALALGSALIATPASAGNVYGSAYVGLRGSFVWTDDGTTRSAGAFDYDEHYGDGYAVGVDMGWTLSQNFRLAIEGEYRHAALDTVTIIRDDLPPPPVPYPLGSAQPAGGQAQIGTAMVNLFYDADFMGDWAVPYIGAGLGGAFIDYNIDDPQSTVTFQGQDQVWAFAYQFMAGLTFPLDDGMSVSVGYKYFKTDDFTYVNAFGENMNTAITQQSIDVGLQFHL